MTNDTEDRNKGQNMDSLDVTLKSSCFITHEETGSLKRETHHQICRGTIASLQCFVGDCD